MAYPLLRSPAGAGRTHVDNILASLSHRRSPSARAWFRCPSRLRGPVGGPAGGGPAAARAAPPQPEAWPQASPRTGPNPKLPHWPPLSVRLRPRRPRRPLQQRRPVPLPLPARRSPLQCPSVAATPSHPRDHSRQRDPAASFPGRRRRSPSTGGARSRVRLLSPAGPAPVLLERAPKPGHCSRTPPPRRPLGRSAISPAHRLARVP